jgi:phosphatidylethanolamine/phosphatidyl-N-methylethanolamine N-methyltransferase
MLSEPREAGPTTALMRKAYARWAPVYDVVYDMSSDRSTP